MRFFLRWIRREVQNDGWWVALFILSLGLGLFGFIGLESFRAGLEKTLRVNARSFLSADLAMSSRRRITEGEVAGVRQRLHPRAESHLVEFFSMTASKNSSRLVQIKAIDAAYPLYGELKLGSGKIVGPKHEDVLAAKPIAWVYPELLSQLQIKVGHSLKVGALEFEVQDTVVEDSTQTFRLGGLAPKVYLSSAFLARTGLVAFGTTLSDVYLFRVPVERDEELEKIVDDLEKEFPDPNLQFESPFGSAQDSSRALQSLLDYLGIVSLVALALSLVGIGYLIQLFLARRVSTLSLLRTLGLRSGAAETFLLLELALLGAFSTLVILPLSLLILPLLSRVLENLLPLPVELGLNPQTAVTSFLLATVFPVLAAWPLLRPFREVNLKQVLLDREFWRGNFGIRYALWWLPAVGLFFALSVWVSHSLRTAGLFMAGLFGAALVVIVISMLILKSLRRKGGSWIAVQARLRLARAPLRFSVVILAISFGTLLLTLLPQIRASLKSELASPESTRLPSLFVFDVQDDQVKSLTGFLEEKNLPPQNLSPLIRSRILAINGQSFERGGDRKSFASREEEAEARFRNRGVNLTFRAELSPSEEIEEGRKFSASPGPIAEISVEKKYAERVGMKLHDKVKFDIQGIELEGEIVNLRSVKWNSFQPNFFISFQPGFLEDAPKIWLLGVPPLAEDKKTELQNAIVAKFPNVSIIDVSRVIEKVMEMTDQMIAALTGMAILSVLVGLFVLFTVLMTEARSRIVEWNLYKVLGASQAQVLKLFLFESAWVSSLAVGLGGLLGIGFSYGLLRWVFAAPFRIAALDFGLAMAAPFFFSFLLSWRLGKRLTRSDAASILAEGRL